MGRRLEEGLKKQAEKEMRILSRLQSRNRTEFDAALESITGKTLTFVSADDERRLLRLAVWAEKYKVTIAYILNVLFPYYREKIKRRPKQGSRLPVRIPTLTGKASEWLLKQQLEKDFPNGENRALWQQSEREALILRRDQRQNGADEYQPRRKKLMDFDWPGRYVTYYANRIREQRRVKELARQASKQSQKPYRGNPFL